MLPSLDYYLTEAAIKAQLPAPSRAYASDAGIDLRSLDAMDIGPGAIVQVPTGVGFQIPTGWFGLICNRTSGGRRGLLPMGHVVDAGYAGEIILILQNTSKKKISVEAHERVAQMVVMPVFDGILRQIQAEQLTPSERGANRLGSSGKQ